MASTGLPGRRSTTTPWSRLKWLLPILACALAVVQCGDDKNPAAPSQSFTLTIVASPSAGGSVTRSPNVDQFASGTTVTLTAVPATGYQFTGWQGDAAGSTNPLTLSMDRTKSVTAAFAPVPATQYTLVVSASPGNGGAVTKAPDQPQYAAGTTVTLTATPAAGYQFTGWQGDAAGSANPLTLTMDRTKTVTAAFAPAPTNQYTLVVSASPGNGGAVTKAPDQPQYAAGTTVTLTATPAAGFQFAGWQGDASGSTNPLALTVDQNRTVTAAFAPAPTNQYTLVVSASPGNGGAVTKAPDQPQYAAGTTVTLTATPAAGYQFTGWQGDATGSANPLTLTMDRTKTVTAAFAPAPTNQYTLVVSASPANGGTVTKAPDQPQYLAGTRVTLTAASAAGYYFDGWQGDWNGGVANPRQIDIGRNMSIVAAFKPVPTPVVSVPSTIVGSGVVSVSYAWGDAGPLVGILVLEESGGGGFTEVARSDGDRTNPWTVPVTRSPGSYAYRARAVLHDTRPSPSHPSYYSLYSAAVSTSFQPLASATQFVNDTQDSFATISLQIDGVERLQYPQQILPQSSWTVDVAPGVHTYSTVNGYVDQGGRHDLYTRSGTYTQPAGGTYIVTVRGRTLADLLAPYDWVSKSGTWIAFSEDYRCCWDQYNDPGYPPFCGTYALQRQVTDTHEVHIAFQMQRATGAILSPVDGVLRAFDGEGGWDLFFAQPRTTAVRK